ncbi:pentapeptide repeat-containing protein [Scytonema sp. UIC 10036]|uniref:pentapeptide repeat-containing protein n=1 Tax=Scytonema sp. UIC 10036 TaxID=2304196 RepID=UPI0012DA316B|nr:pentapeptide repeat-containing protein [Scytonema sp. UIC 10036]MUG91506.1 pentapeptide repeat-containing protein [Scytonema sp. UIC 10036]
MAAPLHTSWYTSFFKFFTKKNQNTKKKPSPSNRKSRRQVAVTLGITFFIVGGIAYLENILKDEKPQSANPANSKAKNPQIIEFIEAYNQNEARNEENKKCKYKFNILTWLICPLSDSKLLGQVQNIGVLSAAILYFWDTFDRKKQLERQAWQLIDGAQGSETSGARKQAIEDLYEEGADITGLDADGADLRGIDLSGADLTRASFKNAILEEANFQGANLRGANFAGANLQGADLRGANLIEANLTGANLQRLYKRNTNEQEIEITTKLQGAKLRRAKLNKTTLYYTKFGEFNGKNTDLSHAFFRKANILNADFRNANIEGAHFGGAKTGYDELDIKIICQAANYKKALYSQSFLNKYPKENFQLDKEYKETLSSHNSNPTDLTLSKFSHLLDLILAESTENTSQDSDEKNHVINAIISLKSKLNELEALFDSASQEISSEETIDNKAKEEEENLNFLERELEEITRYIAKKKKNNSENLETENQ